MDEEDIIFEDGEVVRNIVDSVISIDFSERVLSFAEKSLEYTDVYGHLCDKCPELQQPTTNEEIVAPSVQNKQQAEESAFGPWMVVERRQRKLVIRQDNPGKAANGMVRTAALIPRVKPRGKGKVSATPKPSKPINLRKSPSINFAEFPALSRIQSKASSSHYSSLDQSKHTAVVMNENLNPNVGNLPSDSIPLLFPDCTSPQGEPPDKHAPPSQLPAPRILVDTSQQYTQNVDANDETDTARAVAMLE
ncbi:hypothetical protein V6N11_068889 [Hibiscus sabdariffa]|uniref:Uncharacterized protein n=1 Tax=Hibiscus sabdariffa TaxID=183260 RepID=A0ABR2PB23_9ROSI